MVNAFLVVVTVILGLAIIAGSIYVLVYFQHPEDKNVAWIPKVVVVTGLTLACFSVLMLPLDVGNTSTNGGFPMEKLWQAIYIIMAAWAVVIVPFAMFYYEGDEYDESGEAPSQLAYAIKGTLITFIVFAILVVVLYVFIGIAEIPVIRLDGTLYTTGNRTTPLNLKINNVSEYIASTFTGNNTNPYLNATSPILYNETSQSEIPYNHNITFENATYLCNPVVQVLLNQTVVVTNNVSTGNGTFELVPVQILQNVTLANGTVTQVLVNQTKNVTESVTQYGRCYYYNVQLNPQDHDGPYHIERTRSQVNFRVTPILFIITIVVFFGWLLLIVFGGIGLVALPMDCIASWKHRPIRISLDKYVERKKEIGAEATALIAKGKVIQDRQKRGKERKRDRKNYNKFRQAVFLLEEDYERLQESYQRQGGKLILFFLTFIFGIFGAGLTIVWLLHIILYMFTQPFPINPFLNSMFIKMDDAWGLLGTIFYGIFSFYLLLCCIKGNFKFGMRMFFLFPIHPMRVGGTLMNAFLFNTGLILICAFSVTQFCTVAFSQYTAGTAINSLFALSVNNMRGLKYIFIGYIYALFIFVFLTGIFFALKPKDRPAAKDIH